MRLIFVLETTFQMFRSANNLLPGLAIVLVCASAYCDEEYQAGIEWPAPRVVKPGADDSMPPSDSIVLFDGKDFSAWINAESWTIDNGIASVGDRSIETKRRFGDCQVHLEWSIPVDDTSKGQGRGNSGLYFMPHYNRVTDQNAKYELQILDSYEYETYPDGQAGAIYKQAPPLVNAMRPPGKWNSYDVVFLAPKYDEEGNLTQPAYITAFHNGVLIQNHVALEGATSWNKPPRYSEHGTKLPIGLQSHWSKVFFRNIWVREVQPIQGKQVHAPQYYNRKTKETRSAESLSSKP